MLKAMQGFASIRITQLQDIYGLAIIRLLRVRLIRRTRGPFLGLTNFAPAFNFISSVIHSGYFNRNTKELDW
jgi:hypothetical protein